MNRAIVGLGSCGLAAGGHKVHEALARHLAALGIDAHLGGTGCLGLCYREVLVELSSPELGSCLYGNVTPERVPELLEAHFGRREVVSDLLVARDGARSAEAAFLERQERIVLRNCGRIDPDSLDDYLAAGGYHALDKVLRSMSPAEVVEVIKASGLRGRGGAGFPTGRKWELARASPGPEKFLVCNADEGDPGAFMDRSVIEGDPFSVLEGMAIGAFAIGATRGYVYVREEYPLAVERLGRALETARARGFLGRDLLGTGFSFDVEIQKGAGAFVCGEETALIASLEGRRGTPRRRPPYPVERGLRGRPTCINNVETFANVAWIVVHGADAYARFGTEGSRGTKVFSLAGDVRRTGMVEVPMGISIHAIVEDIGGGSKRGLPIKAVQLGGPSGGCLPASLFDTPIDYESLQRTGAIMGSGGLVVMDQSCCMVDVARYFLSFTQKESCGKCTFCRLGTLRMLEIVERLCDGKGRADDLDRLEQLALQVKRHSLCGLGQTAPGPVLTTLRYFRHEYEAHIRGCCPACKCRGLIHYRIDRYNCDGCTLCQDQCPTKCIRRDEHAIPLTIDESICSRCGGCFEVCQFGAVQVG